MEGGIVQDSINIYLWQCTSKETWFVQIGLSKERSSQQKFLLQLRWRLNLDNKFFLTWHFICFLLDINECLNSSCGNNADCLDLPGGFKCNCKGDFAGKDCNRSKFEKLKTINLAYLDNNFRKGKWKLCTKESLYHSRV